MSVKHPPHPRSTPKAKAGVTRDKVTGRLVDTHEKIFIPVSKNLRSGVWIAATGDAETEPPLSVAEAQRRFEESIAKHREAQVKWIEAFGPPEGWVKIEDLPVDTPTEQSHTPDMTDISREEFNARMETIEVKMDARVNDVSSKIEGFLSAQVERDKAQIERDKRYELLAERVIKAAEGAENAAKMAATVKSNYWAAVGVQLFAVAAILVGAYFATQANTLSAIATTLSAYQAGKLDSPRQPAPPDPAERK